MARYFNVLALSVILLLVIHFGDCYNKHKNDHKKSKEVNYKKTEGSSSEAKSRYVKEHRRRSSRSSEDEDPKPEETEEKLSFVSEQGQKKSSKTSGKSLQGTENSCSKQTRSKSVTDCGKHKKKTRYVLVEEPEEPPAPEPVPTKKSEKHAGKPKKSKPTKKKPVVVIEEEEEETPEPDAPVEEPEYRIIVNKKSPKKNKKQPSYIVIEEAEAEEEIAPKRSKKRNQIIIDEGETENRTGRRLIIEEVQDDPELIDENEEI